MVCVYRHAYGGVCVGIYLWYECVYVCGGRDTEAVSNAVVTAADFLELSSTPDPLLYPETPCIQCVFLKNFSGTSTVLFIFLLLKHLNYIARKPGGDWEAFWIPVFPSIWGQWAPGSVCRESPIKGLL